MPRPRIPRCLRLKPSVYYFKPRGIPLRMLEEVVILPDELEALNLYEIERRDQREASRKMGISQPTFARTLDRAHQKIAAALVEGKAIRIEERIS